MFNQELVPPFRRLDGVLSMTIVTYEWENRASVHGVGGFEASKVEEGRGKIYIQNGLLARKKFNTKKAQKDQKTERVG